MMLADPYATGVLKEEVHNRVVADIANIARDAAIQPHHIWTPLAETCTAKEVEWVRRFKFHSGEGVSGLCLTGKNPKVPIEDHMAAIAGALIRNFIRARVFTVGALLEMKANGSAPMPTCLLIPNFFFEKAEAGQVSSWKVPDLLDLLLDRHMQGLQTVIHVSSLPGLEAEYGSAFAKHIKGHYEIVNV